MNKPSVHRSSNRVLGDPGSLLGGPTRGASIEALISAFRRIQARIKRLIVLDKHYESKQLYFFGRAFRVRYLPSMDDYCKLWKEWESREDQLSDADCFLFWSHVVSRFDDSAKKILSEGISRIPASSTVGAGIQLIDKRDVFIPDNLILKDLFSNCSTLPLFVWTPQPDDPDIPQSKLHAIYYSIGVRTISSSVSKAELLTPVTSRKRKKTKLEDVYIRKGLFMLLLSFLTNPALAADTASRYKEKVLLLFKAAALHTDRPVITRYRLTLSSGCILEIDSIKMIYWDKKKNKIYSQKLDLSCRKSFYEHAINFSHVISKGLLSGKDHYEHRIAELAEMIKVGFLLDFDVDAVNYYMKSKNLRMLAEDEEFLSSFFPSEENVAKKRRIGEQTKMVLRRRNKEEESDRGDTELLVPKSEDA